MGTGLTHVLRARVTASAHIWWDAISSGRFFTPWSLLGAALLVVVVLPPYAQSSALRDVLEAQAVSIVSAVILSVVLLVAVLIERRATRRRVRGIVVIAAIFVFAALRPVVNDVLGVIWFDAPSSGDRAPRVITNLIAWFAVLSLIAVATVRYAGSADVTRRLSGALVTLTTARLRAFDYEQRSRSMLVDGAAALRRDLDDMLGGALDFDRVWAYSDRVRTVSHALLEQSRLDVDALMSRTEEAVVPAAHASRVPVLARLRPPPMLFVGVIFFVGSAPFVVIAGGWPLLALAAAVELPLTLAADLVSRRVRRARDPRARGRVFLASWIAVGMLYSALGVLVLPGFNSIALTPVVSIPGLAVVCALSSHALHHSETQSRRLSRVLREIVSETATRLARTREPLARSADLLHGRVQGRCVVLAATVDEEVATQTDIDAFRRDVTQALDDVASSLSPESVASIGSDLDQILAIWSRVIDTRSEIDSVARSTLKDASVSRRVAAVVNEGFVNAVKHSPARTAVLCIDELHGDGAVQLRVRVITPGSLSVAATRIGGLGIVGLGPSTTLYERDGSVVLESIVIAPVRRDAVDGG